MSAIKRRVQQSLQESSVQAPATPKKVKKLKKAPKFEGSLPTADELGIQRDKKGRLSAKGLGCLFSGEQTITPKARFIPGYDAKLKSLLGEVLKGDKTLADVRPEALVFLQDGPVAGFQIIRGRLQAVETGEKDDGESEE